MVKIFGSILDVRKGEIGITALMCANYYLILVTYYLLKPARDSLFLVKVSPEQLPLVFIVTALVTAPVVTMYLRASRTLPLGKLMNITSGVLIANLLILRWLVQINQPWVYYLFYTWVSVYGALTTSQFWLLANTVFDAAQAKRIFVLLGLAGIVGAFTGGEVTSIIVKNLGVSTEDLLFFCMGMLVVCIVLVSVIWVTKTKWEGVPKPVGRIKEPPKEKLSQTFKLIYRSRHLSISVGIIAVMMMVASFVDFQFKTVSFEAFSTKAELTAFLGKFYGRLSLVSLFLQMFFSYRLIRILGVSGVMMFLPACLMLGSIAMFIIPGLTAGVLLRGTDGSLKYSLDKTGRELLFLPVPLEVKKRTKIFIDMFVDRWFRGLAGGLLLLCTMVLGLAVREISIVVVVLLAVWLVLVLMMRKEYVNSFRRAVEKREIDLSELRMPINDTETVNALIVSLGSNNERQVIYALEILASVKDVELVWPLRPLLDHRSALVRSKALELLQVHGDKSLLGDVEKLLTDENIIVRREAIHFIKLHSQDGAEQKLKTFLTHEDHRIRFAAIACIAEHTTETNRKLIDRDLVDSILDSDLPGAEEGRVQLAKVLGAIDSAGFGSYLQTLLNDPSPRVVKEAMASVGRLKARSYVPWLLEKLGDRNYRGSARSALSAFGAAILGTLNDYLNDPNTPFNVRRNIPRVLARIPAQESVDILTNSLETVDSSLKYHVVKGLNHLRARHSELKFDSKQLHSALINESRMYYEILQVLQAQSESTTNPASKLLRKALEEKQQQNLERIFRLLGLVYPPRDIYNAYHGIVSGKKTLQANAVEFLDNLLRSDVKKYISPILDDVSAETVLRRAQELFDIGSKDREEALAHLITGRDNWLRCCAIYDTRGVESPRLRSLVHEAGSDPDPIIAETARLVLKDKPA